MLSADILDDIQSRLKQWRRRLLLQWLLYTLAASTVLIAIAMLLTTPLTILLQQLAVLGFISFALMFLSRKWRLLNTGNFLAHLNRRFPSFEESAQLLIVNVDDLTAMQKLQALRAREAWPGALTQVEQWRPPVRYRLALTVSLTFALLALFSDEIHTFADRWLPSVTSTSMLDRNSSVSKEIGNVSVSITPPAYTGGESIQTDKLNLELTEGSDVRWTLSLDSDAERHLLELSDGHRINLVPDDNHDWVANSTISKTDLYRIIGITGQHETALGDIYSLTVTLDQAPDIRVIEPDQAALEIPKTGPAFFNSKVLINDDHGVQEVEILASVAKGSGEGVKFRDQKLVFDTFSDSDKGMIYERSWDLSSLGMEPGDEIYFTVIATDNRQPAANTGRSETLIVRWLEDEPAGMAAEGLAIDFIPEFFKSQRQIIIDTEQLIEDSTHLEQQAFKDTSYEIGQAQADLKHKYGQYLGDEFGEGPGEQLGIMHEIAAAAGENETVEEGTVEDDHANDQHGHENTASINTRITTTAEILQLFGHDHGDPELGPITRRNPVALMKRAVNEMWQAEKHLMQAEPESALPYEYEAWKYLKLARQADRIYVKRLGFEPPPVTEDRRLTGELDEILSYETVENMDPDERTQGRADQHLLRQTYHALSSLSPDMEIDAAQRELLSRMSSHLMVVSQTRPALIQHASTIEKILLAGHTGLTNCNECVRELSAVLWNMMDEGDATLRHPGAVFYNDDELVRRYQEAIQSPAGVRRSAVDDL